MADGKMDEASGARIWSEGAASGAAFGHELWAVSRDGAPDWPNWADLRGRVETQAARQVAWLTASEALAADAASEIEAGSVQEAGVALGRWVRASSALPLAQLGLAHWMLFATVRSKLVDWEAVKNEGARDAQAQMPWDERALLAMGRGIARMPPLGESGPGNMAVKKAFVAGCAKLAPNGYTAEWRECLVEVLSNSARFGAPPGQPREYFPMSGPKWMGLMFREACLDQTPDAEAGAWISLIAAARFGTPTGQTKALIDAEAGFASLRAAASSAEQGKWELARAIMGKVNHEELLRALQSENKAGSTSRPFIFWDKGAEGSQEVFDGLMLMAHAQWEARAMEALAPQESLPTKKARRAL